MEALGPYGCRDLISRGPFSEVWSARGIDGRHRDVAIKRGPGLRDEAAALASVVHPNVVPVLEVVPDGDGVALVMPLVEGGSLDELLVRRARLAPADAVAVLAPLADALGAAHRAAGVVHGDVKPANVLLGTHGTPLLADFGAAHGSALIGSAAFVDPHLLETGRPEPANDIYSLAVVAYLALTGAPPHTGATDGDVLDAARRGQRTPLLGRPDIPRPLGAAVEAALALDPHDRPATAEQFAEGLRASVAAGGVTRTFGPRPTHPGPEPLPVPVRRIAAIGIVAAAVVGAAGVAGVAAVVAHRTSSVRPSSTVEVGRGRLAACPPIEPLEVPSGARGLRGDLAGDGCRVPVTWDGSVMQVRVHGEHEPRRYDFTSLGVSRRSGELLLGDWDCDGSDSPAFYDPATGQVHYSALVPRSGELSAQDVDTTGVEDGHAVVRRRGHACDRVEVD